MTRFLLVGAGRIGKIHAENIVRSGRGSLAYVTDRIPQPQRSSPRTWNARRRRAGQAADRRCRRCPDCKLHRHSCRLDRTFRGRRQGGVLREAARSRHRTRRELPANCPPGWALPLYMGFNRRYDPSFARLKRESHVRRDRKDRDRAHHQPRSVAAAGRIRGALGRPVPRHDDPRPRHGSVDARRGAGGGFRPRQRTGRQGNRRRG